MELLLREALILRALKVERSGTPRRSRPPGTYPHCLNPA